MIPGTSFRDLIAAFTTMLLVTPCLGGDLDISDAPQWVNKGTTYAQLQGDRLFHGVGSAPPMGDIALQRAVAKDRARRELARIVSAYLHELTGDYLAAAKAGNRALDAEVASQRFTRLGKVIIPEAKMVARWRDQRTGTIYTLVQLTMAKVKEIAASGREIDASARSYLDAHGDEAFDRVARGAK